MNIKKIYFPLSPNNEHFIAMTNSRNGIIIPVVSKDERRFHITAYIKKIDDNLLLDIHVKDDIIGKYHSILRKSIRKITLKRLENKFKDVALEIFPIISKYLINEINIDLKNLYCIDCALSKTLLPLRFNKARKFWNELENIEEKDLFINRNCANPKHKTFYDPQKGILHKIKDSIFLIQSNSLMNELENIYKKYFFEEIKYVEKLIEKIIKVIERERKKYLIMINKHSTTYSAQ
jgi:ribosomal protein S26